MPSFLASLFLFWSSLALAADNPVACQGASCKVLIETRDGSNVKVTAGQASGTGAWTLGPSGFSGTHTVRGNSAYTTGGATHSSNIGTLSTSAYWYKANITVATVALLGVSGGVDGRVIVISNTGSATGDIRNEDAGAAAADRIITGTGASLSSWLAGGTVTLVYDGAASRWRVVTAFRAS